MIDRRCGRDGEERGRERGGEGEKAVAYVGIDWPSSLIKLSCSQCCNGEMRRRFGTLEERAQEEYAHTVPNITYRTIIDRRVMRLQQNSWGALITPSPW